MSPSAEIQLVAVVTAVACALPGVFLVLRRVAMLSDAIGHAILPGIVVAFLLMMNLVNIVALARGVFKISFLNGGPTELRIVMILVNTLVWALGNRTVEAAGHTWTAFDLFGLFAVPAFLSIFALSAVREGRLLARLDPPPAGRAGTNREA